MALKIKLTSVPVDDQQKASEFYTNMLGFVKKHDIDMGGPRWLTVAASDNPDVELLLEPIDGFAPAKGYQKALHDAGIPWTAFEVDDAQKEYERLKELGVKFKSEPKQMGPTIVAVFEDTCGNLIQIYQMV